MKNRFTFVRRFIGYACIGAVWMALAVLLGFFAMTFAIYRDLRAPDRSHLVAGTPLDSIAETVFAQNFWPFWPSYPDCAQYDPELIYVPKPGVARFRGPEFDTTIAMTPEGLREPVDRAARAAGQFIVLLGDSYTLGWGVDDRETFSAVLQQRFHHFTINSGVASYGTARELLRLRRLGLLTAAKMLVIQYCPNDAPENQEFLKLGDGRISARDPRQQWARIVGGRTFEVSFARVITGTVACIRQRAEKRSAWRSLAELAGSPVPPEPSFDERYPENAREFLAVIDRFPELVGKPILVTELQPFEGRSNFLGNLEKIVSIRSNIRVLRLSLAQEDYFRFDGHLRASGNERVAEQLDRAIRSFETQLGSLAPQP